MWVIIPPIRRPASAAVGLDGIGVLSPCSENNVRIFAHCSQALRRDGVDFFCECHSFF
jgi:hypothetical protein